MDVKILALLPILKSDFETCAHICSWAPGDCRSEGIVHHFLCLMIWIAAIRECVDSASRPKDPVRRIHGVLRQIVISFSTVLF